MNEIKSIEDWFDISNSLFRFNQITGRGELLGQASIEIDEDGTGHYTLEVISTPMKYPKQEGLPF
jgi:hypothetical protein